MPLYEYECAECGRRTEVIQRFSDDPLTACPECGGPVKRLLSAPAVQFKGSGWYVTDYAGKKAPAATESESAAKPAATDGKAAEASGAKADSASGKGEAKAAAKAPAAKGSE